MDNLDRTELRLLIQGLELLREQFRAAGIESERDLDGFDILNRLQDRVRDALDRDAY